MVSIYEGVPDFVIMDSEEYARQKAAMKSEIDRAGQPWPVAGVDYDPDAPMCQDDYEYFTGTGQYANDEEDADMYYCGLCGTHVSLASGLHPHL